VEELDQDLDTEEAEKSEEKKDSEESESKAITTVGLKENLANSGTDAKREAAPGASDSDAAKTEEEKTDSEKVEEKKEPEKTD